MNSFDNIIGYDNIKTDLLQIADMLKNEAAYKGMGASIPSGILIVGEPGLGKTTLARAFIEECGVKSFTVKNNQMNKSVLLKSIVDAFSNASKEGKAIVFLDDMDKFSETKAEDSDDEAFACIQSCIDDCKGKGVLVVATVNNASKLPKSLKRSGRFDRRISIETPTGRDAAKIIEYYLRGKNVGKDVNIDDVQKMISYESCASLESIINESAISAAYRRGQAIEIDDIVRAYYGDLSSFRSEQVDKLDEEAQNSICIHEAGHAAIGECLKQGSVGFVSAFESKKEDANGFTKFCYRFNNPAPNVMIALAGKGACELFDSGYCAMGCESDLDKAVEIMRNSIGLSGYSGLGNLKVMEYSTSEFYTGRLEMLTQSEIVRCFYETKGLLLKNKDFVLQLSDELKRKGYLLHSDVKRLREACRVAA